MIESVYFGYATIAVMACLTVNGANENARFAAKPQIGRSQVDRLAGQVNLTALHSRQAAGN